MPLQWFVLFGLEYTSEVWQGKVEPERNEVKGLAVTKESARGLKIPPVNNSVRESLHLVSALFNNIVFTTNFTAVLSVLLLQFHLPHKTHLFGGAQIADALLISNSDFFSGF